MRPSTPFIWLGRQWRGGEAAIGFEGEETRANRRCGAPLQKGRCTSACAVLGFPAEEVVEAYCRWLAVAVLLSRGGRRGRVADGSRVGRIVFIANWAGAVEVVNSVEYAFMYGSCKI
jgi:hypothetical protein